MKIDPEAAGLDATRLERVTDHLRTRYIDPGKIAGCQTLVYRHGTVGYFSSLGSMDLERGKPVGDDTIWRLYSMTKPVTGVALMTLYERGHFQLNDPVDRFIPEFRGLKVRVRNADGSTALVEPERPMTVRHALMHMTGLGWGVEGPLTRDNFLPAMRELRAGAGSTLQSLVEYMADKPLEFHPGDTWLYGISTDICGKLVENISGRPLDEYMRDEIFGPLQMHDTAFMVDDDRAERFAACYGRAPDKTLRLIEDPTKGRFRRAPTFLSGGDGLVGTTEDYLRFTRMLLNGGELDGHRVLGRKTIELMTTNHLPGDAELRAFALPGGYGEDGFDGVGFGLTMAVGKGPVASAAIGSAGEFYWGGAASTIFWVDPAEDLIVIFMTQLMPSGSFNFRGQLKAIVYPSIVD